jgi:uncharacterized protein YjbJ (UPF0337 family)
MFPILECTKLGGTLAYGQGIAGDKAMDKNRIVGPAKEVKGVVKEAIGKATGDARLQAEGRADKAEGKVQKAIGGAMDTMRDALKK